MELSYVSPSMYKLWAIESDLETLLLLHGCLRSTEEMVLGAPGAWQSSPNLTRLQLFAKPLAVGN